MFNVRRFWYRLRKYKVTEEQEGDNINLRERSERYSKIRTPGNNVMDKGTPGSDVTDKGTSQTFKVGTSSFTFN